MSNTSDAEVLPERLTARIGQVGEPFELAVGVLATPCLPSRSASTRCGTSTSDSSNWPGPGDALSHDVEVMVGEGDGEPQLALNLRVRRQTAAAHISGRAGAVPARYAPRTAAQPRMRATPTGCPVR